MKINKESIILITKDAFCADYLPCYGNKYWEGKTPNIDELAKKGIVYKNYYTAAPSSAMAYLSMFTGKFPYQQEIKTYKPATGPYAGTVLFDKAHKMGYNCHIIWDEAWMNGAYRYSECYGQNTTIHPIKDLRQGVGFHYIHDGFLKSDNKKSEIALNKIKTEVEKFVSEKEKVFLWIHLPHVINGRVAYGSDIDLFDEVVGMMRKYFADDNIFISADHGNMNGHKGKLGYGFDVHNSAIQIPLIAPKKKNLPEENTLMCNIDLYEILFGEKVPKRKFIYVDSAYYAQPNRNLAIINGKYKYVYHKTKNIEELYDLEWDPNEEFNIMKDTCYDIDRKVQTPSRELYFYPEWEKLPNIRKMFQDEKKKIWRDASLKQKIMNTAKNYAIIILHNTRKKKIK